MPSYVVGKLTKGLNGQKKPINGSKVLFVGLAYKANVDDDRESPTYVLMDLVSNLGASVEYHDPFVPVIRATREHLHWAGKRSVDLKENEVSGFDAVVISTAHACVDYRNLFKWSKLIIDTRNAISEIDPKVIKS